MPPLALAIVGFALGALLLIGGVWLGSRSNQLDLMAQNGQRVSAQVIGERTEEYTTRRNGRTRTSHDYWITVKFQHPDGRVVREEIEVDRGVHFHFQSAGSGSGVNTTVVMDPANPQMWKVEDQLKQERSNADTMKLVLPLIGLVFLSLGVFGTVQHLRKKNAPLQPFQPVPPQPPFTQQLGTAPYQQPVRYPQPPRR